MDAHSLKGAFTALVTPFQSDDAIDEVALRRLVDRQIESGMAGVVPCGTTGEAVSLTPDEHQRVVKIVATQTDGQAIVLAGAGASNTTQAIELSMRCEDAGADCLLHVTPAYIKPTQAGLIRHFEAILGSTNLPIVLYNVPGRTAVTLSPATILKLAQHPQVIGLKQAVADLSQLDEILIGRDASLAVLSGEDSLTLPMISLGADGVVSVVGNQQPRLLAELVSAARAGKSQQALRLHRQLVPLMVANFVESNPIPVKFTLAEMGLIENRLRTPMTTLLSENEPVMIDAMQQVMDTSEVTQLSATTC